MTEQQRCRELGPAECRTYLENEGKNDCIVLDVRTPAEYAGGHIGGAVNLDSFSPAFRELIADLDRNKKYLVYCKLGTRGSRTLALMRQLGFRNVINVRGGIIGLREAGFPVEK